MKQYIINHLDGNGETFVVEAETAGKAKWYNYCAWHDVFSGTFQEYLKRIISCRIYRT